MTHDTTDLIFETNARCPRILHSFHVATIAKKVITNGDVSRLTLSLSGAAKSYVGHSAFDKFYSENFIIFFA